MWVVWFVWILLRTTTCGFMIAIWQVDGIPVYCTTVGVVYNDIVPNGIKTQ